VRSTRRLHPGVYRAGGVVEDQQPGAAGERPGQGQPLSHLDRIRGQVPAKRHNARTTAALTSNPDCARRGVLDAAGVDKDKLATRLGFPPKFGQSEFAITRGSSFEAQVKANGCAELLRLLRESLGLDLAEVGYTDLEEQCSKPVDERRGAYPPGEFQVRRNRVEPARQRGPGRYARAYRSQPR
jgi:hypothetical protein